VSEPELGRKYPIDTIIPPVDEHTRFIYAGAVAFGVEYRMVNEDIVLANLKAHGMDRPPPGARQLIDEDGGVSLHVCDAETRTEYLRFDMFTGSPHYHYLKPGEYQINIAYDANASGEMREWALGCIRERLPAMLAFCGAAELAARVDQSEIEAALPRLTELVGRTAVSG
jgi:hypothetical protein